MAYAITKKYIKNKKARPETKREHTLFIVAHDTGNEGAPAENHFSYFSNITISASAHTFIDDKQILEIIPLDEKAWHVLYGKPVDNHMFGDDANDAAIGVELCFGGDIDWKKAYARYVWYIAYLCHNYKLDPKTKVVGHYTLDPERKTDPVNAFKKNGTTWDKFMKDLLAEYDKQGGKKPATKVKAAPILVKKGSTDKEKVKQIQHALALPADGIFGNGTYMAVRNFQAKHNLTVDGIVGQKTWDTMF